MAIMLRVPINFGDIFMFGLSNDATLLLNAFLAILALIIMITRLRIHPFIALIITSGFLGLMSGMPLPKIVKSFQDGDRKSVV